jgi:hypothetical protein
VTLTLTRHLFILFAQYVFSLQLIAAP